MIQIFMRVPEDLEIWRSLPLEFNPDKGEDGKPLRNNKKVQLSFINKSIYIINSLLTDNYKTVFSGESKPESKPEANWTSKETINHCSDHYMRRRNCSGIKRFIKSV